MAALEGKKYSYVLDRSYRWEAWAAPKGKDGKLYHNTALTGDDLIEFVNQKLQRPIEKEVCSIFNL
jgi:type I restriction enzyme M protein